MAGTINNLAVNCEFVALKGTTLYMGVQCVSDLGDTITTTVSGLVSDTNATWRTAVINAIKQVYADNFGDTFAASPNYKLFGWPLSSSG